MINAIETARNEVRKHKFGTAAYEAAFEAMSALTKASAAAHNETFYSVDSGVHHTRLLNGRVI